MEAGTDVTLECSSNASASSISWLHGAAIIISGCTSSGPQYVTTSTGDDCPLTASGSYGVQGLYGCGDGIGKTAQAIVIVIGIFFELFGLLGLYNLSLGCRITDYTYLFVRRSVCSLSTVNSKNIKNKLINDVRTYGAFENNIRTV